MKGRQVMRTVRTPRVCRIRHDRGVRRDQRIGLLVIVTGVFMLSLDVTMLDIVLPDFATAIGADQTQISWIADCYNVALAGLILVGAGLGGRFGQRRVYLSGLVIFGVGSIAASIVSDPVALIAARTVMGIGAADNPRAVRWKKAKDIGVTWVVTIPGAALVAIQVYALLNLYIGSKP